MSKKHERDAYFMAHCWVKDESALLQKAHIIEVEEGLLLIQYDIRNHDETLVWKDEDLVISVRKYNESLKSSSK